MENVAVPKPKDHNNNENKIYCPKCEKEIIERATDNVFKITMGLLLKQDFIPAEKTVYYHQKCLK